MKQVGIYARVSSERQAQEGTVESQVASLRERIARDGHQLLPSDVHVDEGYSGSTLLRPALERVRDRAAEGNLDILYVLSPDRLARKYAYQVLLMEELTRAGVDVVFTNRQVGDTPEDELLLQVQGMIAEYERAKIMERHRRGRLHKARSGIPNALAGAPYGFLYVRRTDGRDARYEIIEDEARVVRQVFDWFVLGQLPIRAIARRLTEQGILTRTGLKHWDPSTIWAMLRNPACAGRACYGKTAVVERESVNRRALRSKHALPRRAKTSQRDTPKDQWIQIEVPAIVSSSLFEAAQEQLKRNRDLAPRNNKRSQYLLRGLIRCHHCQFALYASPLCHKSAAGKTRRYFYYRCIGRNRNREAGRICDRREVRGDKLDQAVWENVKEVLRDPERVLQEFLRRGTASSKEADLLTTQRDGLQRAKRRADSSLQRLLDAYEAGVIDISELKPRLEQVRAKVQGLENQLRDIEKAMADAVELREVATHVSEFAEGLKERLDTLDFEERARLVRLLVKRVEVDHEDITIIYRVASGHG